MTGFDVAAAAYDRFMGRWSAPLAEQVADRLDLRPGLRVLDVGSGPGALTTVLARAVGAEHVAAVDPEPGFVAALLERVPGVDARVGGAESLPFPDAAFDRVAAQLVVHFLRDPLAGARELARVTEPGGLVAVSVWDFAGDRAPVSLFWQAARDLDPAVRDESGLPGARAGDLGALLRAAGLEDVVEEELHVDVAPLPFDDWWRTYTAGVGPAGTYLTGLDDAGRDRLRQRCAERFAASGGATHAVAWSATGRR